MIAFGAHLPRWQRAGLLLAIAVDVLYLAYLARLCVAGLAWLVREVAR